MCGQRQALGEASLNKLALVLSREPEVRHGGLRNREQEVKAPHKEAEVEGHMWEAGRCNHQDHLHLRQLQVEMLRD